MCCLDLSDIGLVLIGLGVTIPLVFGVIAFIGSDISLIWRFSISLVVFGFVLIIIGVFRDKSRDVKVERKY